MAALVGTAGLGWAAALSWVWLHERALAAPAGVSVHTALVLGCNVGPGLVRRVRAAVGLLHDGRAQRIVVSGRGEARVAAALARQMGAPPEALQMETEARSTYENLAFSRPWLGTAPFWLVSDRYHLPRALRMARRLGLAPLPCPATARVSPARRGLQLGRESVSVIHAVVRGRL